MKLFCFLLLVVAFSSIAFAWDKDDYEIFDLVSDLEAAEGKGINFYSHLGIDPSASTNEINKAYRKKSLELHPDKNPGVKDIQARFARLGVISQILRSPVKRERYNFFYKNGVPTWRGTGYYYSRFRPTLLHTLLFLIFLTSLFHLLVLKLNYNRDSKRVDYFAKAALENAKNNAGKREKAEGVGSGWGRRVKVQMMEGNDMAGHLELVVVDDGVYLPHDDGTLTPLSTLASPPSFFRTWPFTLSISLLRRATFFLPPSLQSHLPASLQPPSVQELHNDQVKGYDVIPDFRRKGRAFRSRTDTPRDTPRDSPATTELESEGEDEEVDGNGEVEGDTTGKAKKKRGPGKASALRRRKMGLKK